MQQPMLHHRKIRGYDSASLRISVSYQGVIKLDEGYWFTPEPTAIMGGDRARAEERLTQRLCSLPSSDRIAGIEYLISVPTESFGNDQEAKRADLVSMFVLWLAETYTRVNIICVLSGEHADKTTFEVWALVTPVTDEHKLACGPWFSPRSKHDAQRIRLMQSLGSLNPSFVLEDFMIDGDMASSRIVEGFYAPTRS